MHAFGGLYLDIDVECFTRTDQLLQDRDIVLQLEDKDPKSLNNGEACKTIHILSFVKVLNGRGAHYVAFFLGGKCICTSNLQMCKWQDKCVLVCLAGVMASVRGHPFWVTVMNLMLARGSIANKRSFLGFKDLSTILKSTGGLLLATNVLLQLPCCRQTSAIARHEKKEKKSLRR